MYILNSNVVENCAAIYTQCGGISWTGTTTCCSGLTCQYINAYYYQCLTPSGASTSSNGGPTASTAPTTTVGNNGGTPGVTTRYWDCCKASCGWPYKASVNNPVKTCAANGNDTVDPNTQSGCNGGTAYMCNNQQPWNVSATLSYGYAAAALAVSNRVFHVCNNHTYVFVGSNRI
jgi:hypothetical protein